jgi:hypothetical protein
VDQSFFGEIMNCNDVVLPYIGVTDFMTRIQVENAKKCIQPASGRRLHVGAMMSYKTFHGIPTENGWENIWLSQEGLRQLFVPDEEVFNVLHWADYGPTPQTTARDLITACKSCGPGLSGLQLDMIWPDYEMIMDVKDSLPNLSVILQVSKIAIKSMQALNFSLEYKLCSYKGRVDYVLLDYGMGKGVAFVPQEMLELVTVARVCFPESAIAVAGGLSPTTLFSLDPILQRYPGISWDAQGQLRKSGNAADPLDIKIMHAYLRGSSKLATFHMCRQIA